MPVINVSLEHGTKTKLHVVWVANLLVLIQQIIVMPVMQLRQLVELVITDSVITLKHLVVLLVLKLPVKQVMISQLTSLVQIPVLNVIKVLIVHNVKLLVLTAKHAILDLFVELMENAQL